jgi:hypothetical protein
LHLSQNHETEKYVNEPCGTRDQEWLLWQRPAVIYPTKTLHHAQQQQK